MPSETLAKRRNKAAAAVIAGSLLLPAALTTSACDIINGPSPLEKLVGTGHIIAACSPNTAGKHAFPPITMGYDRKSDGSFGIVTKDAAGNPQRFIVLANRSEAKFVSFTDTVTKVAQPANDTKQFSGPDGITFSVHTTTEHSLLEGRHTYDDAIMATACPSANSLLYRPPASGQ